MAYLGNSLLNKLYSFTPITATAGQTVFSAGYAVGLTLFFLTHSGSTKLLQVGSDVTAADGSTITLASGASVGDVLTAVSLAQFNATNAVPPGVTMCTAAPAAPSGWLLCDGSPVSRTTYPALFGAIGTTWGVGDGSTTFNVPDFRGKVAVGAGGGFTLAGTGGEATHTLTLSETPNATVAVTVTGTAAAAGAHTHTVTDPTHSHTFNNAYTGGGTAGTVSGGTPGPGVATPTAAAATGISLAGAADHTHTVSATGSGTTGGSGAAHNNLQPYAVANYIIKT